MRRGDLKGLVASLASSSNPTLKPATYSFSLLDYNALFEPSPGSRGTHLFGSAVGDTAYDALAKFYQNLTGSIFGYTHAGRLVTSSQGDCGYPDFLHTRRRFGFDSKAVVQGRPLDLRDNQMGYLSDFQRTHPSYKVSFMVSRYHKPPVALSEMNSNELVEFLANATAYMLVMPLSVANPLFEDASKLGPSFSFRYEGSRNWLPRSRVHSAFIDRLVSNPASAITKLGLNPDDYKIKRFVSSSRLKCHDSRVSPFPIIKIADYSHRKWVKSFLSGFSKSSARHPNGILSDSDGCSDISEEETAGDLVLTGAGEKLPF